MLKAEFLEDGAGGDVLGLTRRKYQSEDERSRKGPVRERPGQSLLEKMPPISVRTAGARGARQKGGCGPERPVDTRPARPQHRRCEPTDGA